MSSMNDPDMNAVRPPNPDLSRILEVLDGPGGWPIAAIKIRGLLADHEAVKAERDFCKVQWEMTSERCDEYRRQLEDGEWKVEAALRAERDALAAEVERLKFEFSGRVVRLTLENDALVAERDELKRLCVVDKTDHRFQPYHNMLEDVKAERDALAAQLAELNKSYDALNAEHEEKLTVWKGRANDAETARMKAEIAREELAAQLAKAEACARGSADLVCSQRERIARLERALAYAKGEIGAGVNGEGADYGSIMAEMKRLEQE